MPEGRYSIEQEGSFEEVSFSGLLKTSRLIKVFTNEYLPHHGVKSELECYREEDSII